MKRKSSWHQRRRSKILAVSLKHWKGRGEGGGGYLPHFQCIPPPPPPPPPWSRIGKRSPGAHPPAPPPHKDLVALEMEMECPEPGRLPQRRQRLGPGIAHFVAAEVQPQRLERRRVPQLRQRRGPARPDAAVLEVQAQVLQARQVPQRREGPRQANRIHFGWEITEAHKKETFAIRAPSGNIHRSNERDRSTSGHRTHGPLDLGTSSEWQRGDAAIWNHGTALCHQLPLSTRHPVPMSCQVVLVGLHKRVACSSEQAATLKGVPRGPAVGTLPARRGCAAGGPQAPQGKGN